LSVNFGRHCSLNRPQASEAGLKEAFIGLIGIGDQQQTMEETATRLVLPFLFVCLLDVLFFVIYFFFNSQ
jgi:hypothetical protein